MHFISKPKFQFILSLLACGIIGSLIAFIPHIAVKVTSGNWEFYHDQDEVLYRMIAKPALDGSWKMRDVFVQSDRDLPTNYSWMQFVPTSHLATVLGFNAISLGQFWRILGGFGTGIACFLVFFSFNIAPEKRILFAFLCSLIALSDAGFAAGRVLIENFRLLYFILQGQTPKGEATSFTLYRVITPLWNLPISLLAAALINPVVLKSNPRLVIPAILTVGLTVMLYFFQWTALFSGGGICLSLYLIWDMRSKTGFQRATFLGIVALCLGIALGLPQILSNAATFSSPEMKQILDRVGRGQKIPFGDPSRWNNVINRWAWIKILMAFAIAYSLKNRGLVLFSTIGTIAYFLSISVFITGIEFENWHWLYVINPFLAVVIYTGLVRFLFIRQHVSIALSLTLLLFASSLYLRYQEALIAPDAIEMKNWSEGTKPMRPIVGNVTDDGDSCIAGRQAARILSLSMPGGRILFHEPHSAHTSLMSDEEVHERYVLNYWLMGGTREDLASRPANQIFKMYIFANTRPDWDREVVRSKQLAVFDRLERENGQTAMAKYQPVFLLLDKTSLDHPPVRGGHWQKVGQSRDYVLWKMVKNISSAD